MKLQEEYCSVSQIYKLFLQFFEVPVKSLKSPVGASSSGATTSAASPTKTQAASQNTTVIQVSTEMFGTYQKYVHFWSVIRKWLALRT
jgi:hypothetical protein